MRKNQNTSLIIAASLCAISLIVMFASLAASGRGREPAEFVPPAFDENAIQGFPDVPDHLGWGEVDAQVYKAYLCGEVTICDGKALVWFTNPQSNTVWLKLRVLDADGGILGETGLIRPGEYVQYVSLNKDLQAFASIGLKLMAYEPETYYSEGSVVLHTTVTEVLSK